VTQNAFGRATYVHLIATGATTARVFSDFLRIGVIRTVTTPRRPGRGLMIKVTFRDVKQIPVTGGFFP